MAAATLTTDGPYAHVAAFCQRFGLRVPILLSPMAGACPVPLSAAVAAAGGMGAMGAVLSQPQDIVAWMQAFRQASDGPAQINLWIPDPAPARDADAEARMRAFLGQWGPTVAADAGDAPWPISMRSSMHCWGPARRWPPRSWACSGPIRSAA